MRYYTDAKLRKVWIVNGYERRSRPMAEASQEMKLKFGSMVYVLARSFTRSY